MTKLEEVEEDCSIGNMEDVSLSKEEHKVNQMIQRYNNIRCRMCEKCEPCPQGIPISNILGIDSMFIHYRVMGRNGFSQFPWSRSRINDQIDSLKDTISKLKSCTKCGVCEERCPYDLEVVRRVQKAIRESEDMLEILGRTVVTALP